MDLNSFLLSPVEEVKDFAERAIRLKTAFEARQLTVEEYTELVDDLLSLKHINEASTSIEALKELWDLVDLIKNIKFLTSII